LRQATGTHAIRSRVRRHTGGMEQVHQQPHQSFLTRNNELFPTACPVRGAKCTAGRMVTQSRELQMALTRAMAAVPRTRTETEVQVAEFAASQVVPSRAATPGPERAGADSAVPFTAATQG
jgi:hypothetical protein